MRSFAGAVILIALSGYATGVLAQMPQHAAPPPQEAGAGLTPRVERLEEQLVDLQGVVAAVETLAKNSSGGSGYAAGGGGASSDQLRQLSEQIAELTQRIERLEARLGAGGPNPLPRQRTDLGTTPPPSGFDEKEPLPPLTTPQGEPDRLPPSRSAQAPSPYGGAIEPKQALPRTSNLEPAGAGGGVSAGVSSGAARTLYDQAYSAFNRREYSAAETYFEQFLQQYPTDPLSGSAQFWLAESAFVSGEYRRAADRYLKAFTNYPSNEKAPEALLKLAISLRRLGENNAACESFAELQRRFPQPPKTVAQRAEAEKRRANCT